MITSCTCIIRILQTYGLQLFEFFAFSILACTAQHLHSTQSVFPEQIFFSGVCAEVRVEAHGFRKWITTSVAYNYLPVFYYFTRVQCPNSQLRVTTWHTVNHSLSAGGNGVQCGLIISCIL